MVCRDWELNPSRWHRRWVRYHPTTGSLPWQQYVSEDQVSDRLLPSSFSDGDIRVCHGNFRMRNRDAVGQMHQAFLCMDSLTVHVSAQYSRTGMTYTMYDLNLLSNEIWERHLFLSKVYSYNRVLCRDSSPYFWLATSAKLYLTIIMRAWLRIHQTKARSKN